MESNTFYLQFEPLLIEFLQRAANPVTETLAVFFTYFGEEMILICVLGFVYWSYDKEYGKFIGTNMIAGLVFCPMIKNIAKRNRPYMVHPNVKCIKPVHEGYDIYDISVQGYSFPSIHSANSTMLYGSLSVYKPKNKVLRIVAVALPLLVGLSRVILGVHYPTDVLCGYAIGIIAILIVSKLQQYRKKRWLLHLVLVLLAAPGIFFCRTEDYFTSYGIMLGFFAALPFEEKFIRFENADRLIRRVLRLLGGIALYFALNSVLKIILPAGDGLVFLIFRMIRYALLLFLLIGVYPVVFRYTGKLFKKC